MFWVTAQFPTSGKTCDIGRRGVFCSTPGSEPARSDAERCQAPVVLRKGAPYQLVHWPREYHYPPSQGHPAGHPGAPCGKSKGP